MVMETMLIIAAVAALMTAGLVGSIGYAVYARAKAQSRAFRQERSISDASLRMRRARRRTATRQPALRRPAVAARAAAARQVAR